MDVFDELGRAFGDLETRVARLEGGGAPPPPPPSDPCPVQVTRIYREELGREPDPGGYANWLRTCQQGMGEAEMRRRFRQSDEYRAKHEPPPTSDPSGRTRFGPWQYGFDIHQGPASASQSRRFYLFPVMSGMWAGRSWVPGGMYVWVQWREDYRNTITGGRDGRLIRYDDGIQVAGGWSLTVVKMAENRLRLTWTLEIQEPLRIYGATSILDLRDSFRRYRSNAEAVYNTTQMSNVNPREGELPDAKAHGWPEAGFAVRDFDWLELSDGTFTVRRTTFGGWHDPPTADCLVDINGIPTWELGWLNGSWRDYKHLPPIQAPARWQAIEEISVTGPGFSA